MKRIAIEDLDKYVGNYVAMKDKQEGSMTIGKLDKIASQKLANAEYLYPTISGCEYEFNVTECWAEIFQLEQEPFQKLEKELANE